LREGKSQRSRAAIIDKEGLTRHVRNSAVYRSRQHLRCIGITFQLHQHKEPTRRLCPTRSIGSKSLQSFEHRAATHFVEPSELGQPPLDQSAAYRFYDDLLVEHA